jgi:bifunctional non-homologous end joining protein LigD
MGTIPVHVWPSRTETIQRPDWCIVDLDPKGAPFEHVILLAREIHSLCEEIGLPNYVKTTGSSGLHVLIPLGAQCTFEQSRLLGHLIARIIESKHREISTTERSLDNRKGRVYLDYLQNRHGQLIVAPYSVRPLPGAPVSAPLAWSEVGKRLEPRKYTIRNLGARLSRRKEDPLLPVLTDRPDLLAALDRLSRLTDRA